MSRTESVILPLPFFSASTYTFRLDIQEEVPSLQDVGIILWDSLSNSHLTKAPIRSLFTNNQNIDLLSSWNNIYSGSIISTVGANFYIQKLSHSPMTTQRIHGKSRCKFRVQCSVVTIRQWAIQLFVLKVLS